MLGGANPIRLQSCLPERLTQLLAHGATTYWAANKCNALGGVSLERKPLCDSLWRYAVPRLSHESWYSARLPTFTATFCSGC